MAFAFPGYGTLNLNGYEEHIDPKLSITPMDSGPAKQAKAFSRTIGQRRLTYTMSASELIAWKVWWRDTIASGADWFNWTDPADGVVRLVRIPGGKYSAKPFVAVPGAVLSWDVTFNIEGWEP